MRATGRGGAWAAGLVLVATGCSGGEQVPSGGGSAPDPTTALRERCLSAIPEDADLEALTLPGATGGDVEAARIGPEESTTVAVLLPQIGGMCGWGRWAHAAAEDAGITSLLLNPCGYGETACPAEADADPLNEVTAATQLARSDLGADRVVLLGTSMGGSLTVIAVAAGAEVDAWADVSGPSSWDGVELATLADDLPRTGLVVMAPSDGRAAFADARALARAAGVPFLPGRSGHGWELLTDPVSGSVTRLGRRLMDLAAGRPGA
ncbi:putative Adenine deaminase-related protein [metagenome]|uniref:Putative Adenine deaminase-related protein n=1 Tax=metagenome TaxID=256318 RepID=A0A2P2CGM5_9ZZZZ